MADSPRHLSPVPPPYIDAYPGDYAETKCACGAQVIYHDPALTFTNLRCWRCPPDNSPRVRWPRVSRLVHQLLRVPPPPERPERSESRPVADQRGSAPVGYIAKADLKLALQRGRSLPDLLGGD